MSNGAPGPDELLRYRPLVRRLSRISVRGAGDADELEQRVWLRILEHPQRSAEPDDLARLHDRECLLESLARIDRDQALVLRLRFLEGRPPSEIADLLGQPVETVRTCVKRGLAQVRARLQRP